MQDHPPWLAGGLLKSCAKKLNPRVAAFIFFKDDLNQRSPEKPGDLVKMESLKRYYYCLMNFCETFSASLLIVKI